MTDSPTSPERKLAELAEHELQLVDLLVGGRELGLGGGGRAALEVHCPAARGEGQRRHGLVPVHELGARRDEEHNLAATR